MSAVSRRRSDPRAYFSLRSPYSWLAYEDLVRTTPELVDELDWRPFWEPGAGVERLLHAAGGTFIYTPMSREKHLYVLGDVRRLASRRGLAITWPVDRDPCWEVPHLAYIAAAEQGAGGAFMARLYRARWREGADICDRQTVARLAGELGLDASLADEAADDERLRRAGVAALLDVYRDGVFGVPFFICGREKFWGVDRLDDFLCALSPEAESHPSESAGAVVPAGVDDGHAGGCG